MTLYSIEMTKTFRRWRTYIGFAAVAGAVILIEVLIKLNQTAMSHNFQRGLSGDFLVSGNILNAWAITALIMNSLYIHVPFLVALVAGDLVSSESTSGTIRFLLIRPPSRSRIIIQKYLAMLSYTALLIVFLAVLCIGLGLALFGSGDMIRFQTGIPHIVVLSENVAVTHTLLAFVAAIVSMSVVGSLAFLFSTMVDNSIGPIIGSMAIVIIFFILGSLPFDFLESIKPYLFTTYMNVWQLCLNQPLDWGEIGKNVLALLGHDVLFFGISYLIFLRKDVKS